MRTQALVVTDRGRRQPLEHWAEPVPESDLLSHQTYFGRYLDRRKPVRGLVNAHAFDPAGDGGLPSVSCRLKLLARKLARAACLVACRTRLAFRALRVAKCTFG
jgi:hypothetical protein